MTNTRCASTPALLYLHQKSDKDFVKIMIIIVGIIIVMIIYMITTGLAKHLKIYGNEQGKDEEQSCLFCILSKLIAFSIVVYIQN